LLPVEEFAWADGKALDASIDGQLLIGEILTVKCPTGYRVGSGPFQQPSAPKSATTSCTRTYQISPRVNCSRLTCGDFKAPENSVVRLNDDADVSSPAGTILRALLYGDEVDVFCLAYHRLSAIDTTCSQRAFRIKCLEDGSWSYVGTSPSDLAPLLQKCVPVQCSMPLIANGQRFPLSGTVQYGADIDVRCNAGYYVSSEADSGQLPLCNYSTRVGVKCDDMTCAFPSQPQCKRPGCYGMAPYKSTDGQKDLVFERSGARIDTSIDGFLSVELAGQYEVTCPEGYRVQDSPPAETNSPRSAPAVCGESCHISRVQCSRVSCGDFSVPPVSSAVRVDESTGASLAFTVGEVVPQLLYSETLTVTCNPNYRLGASDTSCDERSFKVTCNDNGKFAYVDVGLSSKLGPEHMTCVAVECSVGELDATAAVRNPARGTLRYGESGNVTCNAGYHVKPSSSTTAGYKGVNALCSHDTRFSLTCDGATCRFPQSPVCSRRGCQGLPNYKTTDGLEEISFQLYGKVVDPTIDGQLRDGESFSITCPTGYRVAIAPSAQVSLPRTGSALCSSDCSIARVDCSPITCGNYPVPANSMAWHSKKNANVVVTPGGQLVREVLYDETIAISCDPSFHVNFSDFEQCNRNMILRCSDSGVLVSAETSKPLAVTCVAPKKHVECASCFKFWGSDSSRAKSQFPVLSLSALDCNAGRCEPPFAATFYEIVDIPASEQWARDSCKLEIQDSRASPCIPVLCRPFALPLNAKNFEYGGIEYKVDAGRRSNLLPEMHCGHALKIVCEEGFVPEHRIGAGIDCSDNSFNMTCDGFGYWQGFQKCVPKVCVVTGMQHSVIVALNSSNVATCAAGYKIADDAPDIVSCQSNCLMTHVQTCTKVQCSYNHTAAHQTRASNSSSAHAYYGANITVACEEGYVAFDIRDLAKARCKRDFFPTCRADGRFDHSEGQTCVEPSCPPYHSVDANVMLDSMTLMPFRNGTTVQVRCKADYKGGKGYGLNLIGAPSTMYSTPGQENAFERTCLGNCQWSPPERCVPVPCRCPFFNDHLMTLGTPQGGMVYAWLGGPQTVGALSGQVDQLVCPTGYDFTGPAALVTCSDSCTISVTNSLLCQPAICKWSSSNLLDVRGVNATPWQGDSIQIGQSVILQCAQGYELGTKQMADLKDPPVVLAGLEALGKVQVLASMTFPAPRAGEAASFGLTGDFSDITLDLPAGAWPADLLVGPSIAIFEMPAGARRGATVAGLGVNLGPDGIRFPIPVTITAPVLANFDLGNRVLRVHRYNPQTGKQSADSWTPLPYPQGYTVPHAPRVIKATTMSFSAYFVLAVNPGSPGGAVEGQLVLQVSQPGTTPNQTTILKDLLPILAGDETLGLPQTTFIAIVVGGGCGVICLCSLGLYVLFRDSCLGKCLACLCGCLCGCVIRCLCARCCKKSSKPESSWCAVSDNMRSEDKVVLADLVVVETRGKKKD
jgi:hypothetical protein